MSNIKMANMKFGGEYVKIGGEAVKFGGETVKIGGDAAGNEEVTLVDIKARYVDRYVLEFKSQKIQTTF